ncbi:MAG TPA: M12 family metallo-peptidase, partial [Chitinophagales bacterium]|nr:M12 family metallo-peptidase [Chitinophagales bacterium]
MRTKQLLIALLAAFFLQGPVSNLQAQSITKHPIAQNLENAKNSGIALNPVSLFTINATRSAEMQPSIKRAVAVTLDLNALSAMKASNADAIAFNFPYDDRTITLELYRVDILTEDFMVITDQSNGEAIPYTPGIYYRGIVKGDENSVAALSFFDGEMMGVVSSDQYMNINIGKSAKEGAKAYDYVIYSDNNLPLQNMACATPENPDYMSQMKEYSEAGSGVRTTNCVKIYYEMDNNLYINNSSNTTTATNWMTAVHNNVATLYSNDAITTALQTIFIWTTGDPYNGTTSSSQLSKFKANRPTFNGDLGQLVGIDPGGLGGVASTINGMCSSSNKYCYSDVDFSYNTVPTYSWTIMVCTHELGHLMGSAHTQNCGWPGGAIDNCYTTEGGCPPGPAPIGGGTIMSYCHLTSFGINFTKGFGPLPAGAIVGAVNAAGCLSSACVGTCVIPTGLSASAITSSSATLNWSAASGAGSYNVQYRKTGTTTWTATTATTNSKAISGLLQATQYEFQVQSVCTSTSSAFSSSSTFTTTTPVCADNYESNNTKGTEKNVSTGIAINGLINVSSDKDFFSFTNTVSQPNIKVTLTNLPANYDIDFFDVSGTKISSSDNTGTANEEVIFNTGTVGTYKVKIYSAGGGAANASVCYTLLASLSSTPFKLEALPVAAAPVVYPNPSTGDLSVAYNSN